MKLGVSNDTLQSFCGFRDRLFSARIRSLPQSDERLTNSKSTHSAHLRFGLPDVQRPRILTCTIHKWLYVCSAYTIVVRYENRYDGRARKEKDRKKKQHKKTATKNIIIVIGLLRRRHRFVMNDNNNNDDDDDDDRDRPMMIIIRGSRERCYKRS